ncbi:MAG: 50S ribosomal protein L9 [Anaerolineae bacterium]|nr:50S ribosomal protein L9 [Anaerolineae bacterium]MDW8171809.1 50S ribosomal protein L9 [Anaerolineae bacterium]
MKVILLQDIYKTGVTGEIVEVADGYARNYLIPTGRAIQATKKTIKAHERLTKQVEARRAAYEKKQNEVARIIDGTELLFEKRAASTGKLFGSVTTQEIAEELLRVTGVDINRRRISSQGLREVGKHEVTVRIGTEIQPVLHIIVLREGQMQEFLAKRQAEAAAQAAAAATEAVPTEAAQQAVQAAQQTGS